MEITERNVIETVEISCEISKDNVMKQGFLSILYTNYIIKAGGSDVGDLTVSFI